MFNTTIIAINIHLVIIYRMVMLNLKGWLEVKRHIFIILTLSFVLILCGCSSKLPTSPESAVDEMLRAALRNDTKRVYDLYAETSELKAAYSYTGYKAAIESKPFRTPAYSSWEVKESTDLFEYPIPSANKIGDVLIRVELYNDQQQFIGWVTAAARQEAGGWKIVYLNEY